MTSIGRPVILVTGCSRGGIGYYLSEEFARRGCRVYATARDLSKVEGIGSSISSSNTDNEIQKLSLDVTSDSDVESVVQTILEREGRIDVLVNNAGAIAAGALLDQTTSQIHHAFDTNTYSVLRLSRAVVPSMAKRKSGLIVNISSTTESMPTPWNGLYCATKSAVRAISDVLTMECAPLGIQVMNVAPGSVTSNLSTNQLTGKENAFKIPENSLWKAYLPSMIKRINASQEKGSMDTGEFARRIVDRVLEDSGSSWFGGGEKKVQVKRNVPGHVVEGGRVGTFKILMVIPRRWLFWIMWRVYGGTE